MLEPACSACCERRAVSDLCTSGILSAQSNIRDNRATKFRRRRYPACQLPLIPQAASRQQKTVLTEPPEALCICDLTGDLLEGGLLASQGITPGAIFLDCYDAKGRVPAFLTGQVILVPNGQWLSALISSAGPAPVTNSANGHCGCAWSLTSSR